ncbi:MAG: DUF3179 domain-containing protein [Marinovum sp.]|jgi:hypothetical protein|nr:DUF3179 domain-containing protein [Marinovum sp.]MBT6927333.1 DUF3179 domain-containing protein [Marinovum sp.]MBT7589353.1 DUF3179 domain-containing protein [Gemmatimonadota bacterium]
MLSGRAFRGLVGVALIAAIASIAGAQDFEPDWPNTDFSRSTIDLSEVMSGGPPKDGIPALSNPVFIPSTNETRLAGREPVITYAPEGATARAYPVRYLMWHEIVNDTVAGSPIAVTFCPLCNTGIVFSRRLNGQTLSFGVSGLLRNSDMVMYDRESESWWQQALGLGIVGRHSGQELTQLTAWMESWDSFRTAHPEGLVMDEPDWQRDYGQNPYVSYDSSIQPFLYSGESPPHGIAPLARVVRVGNRAWPLERVRKLGSLTEAGVTISWVQGQASALDAADLGAGAEVGNIRVRDGAEHDVVHDIPFAFAFHAFFPDGQWMLGN